MADKLVLNGNAAVSKLLLCFVEEIEGAYSPRKIVDGVKGLIARTPAIAEIALAFCALAFQVNKGTDDQTSCNLEVHLDCNKDAVEIIWNSKRTLDYACLTVSCSDGKTPNVVKLDWKVGTDPVEQASFAGGELSTTTIDGMVAFARSLNAGTVS
jgi:hypothetical protein